MASQPPMISIPKKSTDEVDWTNPIRNAIMHSYGEDPDNYSSECAALQRCRQDAVRGAGSDLTARDLLYKYFGQLELLELRFPEIRVNFPWKDAFTTKTIVQTSLAYEKASIIFNIAATHSAIAASQSRSDPEGIKRAFYYFRCCAGMLTYINDNFLHAPSTDLSRDVIKFLVGVILAQATEVFFEKCKDEKKGNALMSKVASQAASMYTGLGEEVKEFMGKGIFDRNWVTVIQAKAKYFTSVMQYYRGQADHTAGKYGDALVRFQLAETHAKEAHKIASGFGTMFLPQMSPNLPADAGQSISDITKAHLALCTDRRSEAQKDNDLIYNAVLPMAETLPAVDKAAVATPIPIQEIYGTADVQRVIGPDLFQRLIPLSVHESASVYSEEKAKLVRAEVERSEDAEVEARSALDALGIKSALPRFRAMVEGSVAGEDEVPIDVRRWREDISLIEQREGINLLLERLVKVREGVRGDLDAISRELEIESRDCEAARAKYDHAFSQEPSSGLTKGLRADLKSHLEALDAAAASDGQVHTLWDAVSGDIRVLISGDIEQLFHDTAVHGHNRRESLLDLDMEKDDTEKAKIGGLVDQIEERLKQLTNIERERGQTLKDLKDKIQNDDVSHLLLLNRRNPNVEPTIFASELEKFRPYQQRLTQTISQQTATLQEINQLWKTLKDLAGRGEGARKWDERERRKKETVRRFSNARDGYMEARDGLAKGLQFYSELSALTETLGNNVKTFVSPRAKERQEMIGKAEAKQRFASTPSAPPPRPPPPPGTLERSFAGMGLESHPTSPPPTASHWPPPVSNSSPMGYPSPPPSQQYQNPPLPPSHIPPPPSRPTQSPFPPPPPGQQSYSTHTPPNRTPYGGQLSSGASNAAPYSPSGYPYQPSHSSPAPISAHDPYAALGSMSFVPSTPLPPQSQGNFHHQPLRQGSYPPPPPQPTRQTSFPPPPSSQQQYQYPAPASHGHTQSSPFPPPPPPAAGYQQQPHYNTYGTPPPASQHPSTTQSPYPPPPPAQQQTQYNAYGQYPR